MEKSFFFDAVVTDGVPDRSYSAEDLAERESHLISNGVMGGDSLMVEGVSGSEVYLSAGAAVIFGYTYINTGVLYLPIGAGHDTYGRIDTVVLKLDLSGRQIYATVVKGTPAEEPVASVLVNTDTVKYLPLADVYVPAGSSPTVEAEDITDRRVLAGYASGKEDLLLLLREYLGEIAPVDSAEMAKIRKAVAIVKSDAGEERVLCGDGVYRAIPAAVRECAAVYTDPGDYTFDPADHPSVNGMYDIEVQGAGGAGGSFNGSGARGGGGGGGAFISAGNITFPKGAVSVRVGLGGAGVPGDSGEDGGDSAIDGFVAKGGSGGKGGSLASGGAGGTGLFSGGAGANGVAAENGEIYTTCGKGGASFYGEGAPSNSGSGSAYGIDAEYPGAGGSGGTAESGTFSESGGKGGDGMVTVYRYVYRETEEAEA